MFLLIPCTHVTQTSIFLMKLHLNSETNILILPNFLKPFQISNCSSFSYQSLTTQYSNRLREIEEIFLLYFIIKKT